MSDALVQDRPVEGAEDSAKWRQIVEGARKVFMERGFDAASMGDIAKAAGVSKGTLYVYFTDKDELFSAIVGRECTFQAEGVFQFDHADQNVEAVLRKHGAAFVQKMCDPHRLSSMRAVIAIADRMPDLGRKVYEAGPAIGSARLSGYLRAMVDAGVLVIDDIELAAAQFIESTHASLFKPVLFNFAAPPTPERIDYAVGIAVRTFLAAYRAK